MDEIRRRMDVREHCSECGALTLVVPGARICPHCGAEVEEHGETYTPQTLHPAIAEGMRLRALGEAA